MQGNKISPELPTLIQNVAAFYHNYIQLFFMGLPTAQQHKDTVSNTWVDHSVAVAGFITQLRLFGAVWQLRLSCATGAAPSFETYENSWSLVIWKWTMRFNENRFIVIQGAATTVLFHGRTTPTPVWCHLSKIWCQNDPNYLRMHAVLAAMDVVLIQKNLGFSGEITAGIPSLTRTFRVVMCCHENTVMQRTLE